MVYFYALTYDTEFNPNMVFYVGKTVSKEQRLSGHKATFGKNCVLHQIDFLDQYDKLLIAAREQYWINHFRSLNGKKSLHNKNRACTCVYPPAK